MWPDDPGWLGSALAATAIYALSTFAAGFACGTLRILILAPALGAVVAVIIELPIMLATSWLLAAWSIHRLRVKPTIPARFTMGLGAFVLLMLLEFLLAVGLFGQPPGDFLLAQASVAGRIGLCAQLAFAALPLLQLWLIEARPQVGAG